MSNKSAQERPRTSQERLKQRKRAAEDAQDGAKMAQRGLSGKSGGSPGAVQGQSVGSPGSGPAECAVPAEEGGGGKPPQGECMLEFMHTFETPLGCGGFNRFAHSAGPWIDLVDSLVPRLLDWLFAC